MPVTRWPASPTPWSLHGEAGGEAGGVVVADSGVVGVDSAGVIPHMDTIPTMAIPPFDTLRS